MYLHNDDQKTWKKNLALEFSEGNYNYDTGNYDNPSEEAKRIIAELEGATVLFSMNDEEGQYEDSSIVVLFEKDGKLFEVEGGHCSCNGFEGQWSPSPVTIGYYDNIFEKGGHYFVRGKDREELQGIVAAAKARGVGLTK